MTTLSEFFRKKSKKGTFGLECEVEGVNIPSYVDKWDAIQDGSLRGKPLAYEYRFLTPYTFDEAREALEALNKSFREHNSKPIWSFRCSTHVHYNVGDFKISEIAKVVTFYYLVEPVISQFFPEDRLGNRFALRLQDAPHIIENLLNREDFAYREEGYKYASMNLATISSLGSIEFRLMEGCVDPERILSWMEIIDSIFKAAMSYKDVSSILDQSVEDLLKHLPFNWEVDKEMLNTVEYNRSMLIDMTVQEERWKHREQQFEERKRLANDKDRKLLQWRDFLLNQEIGRADAYSVETYHQQMMLDDNDSPEDDDEFEED